MQKIFTRSQKNKKLYIRDGLLTVVVLAVASAICFLLRFVDRSDGYVSMIFILAVFLISRFTTGYFYGIAASLVGVLLVNFLFTYPYYNFNFTLSGYPITILCMLVVAVITGMLTTQIKLHGDIKVEAEKEKTRSNLLRAVSHDLRTPLTSILGASSAIIDNDDALSASERMKLLNEIKYDAQWLIRMVENLLSITRIDGKNTARIVKYPEAVEELVSESVVKFKKRFSEQTVSVKVPDELLMVPMDAMLIEQVIINLLENAVLHSGKPTDIELVVNAEGDSAVFSVADNGLGIDSDVLPRIFDGCYKQEDNTGGDNKRNMGIGLSVCSTIIKAHNGSMTAENKVEGGAVFKFILPMGDE